MTEHQAQPEESTAIETAIETDLLCPCGSGKTYDDCCAPLIRGEREAETAEQLMRARYSAYVKIEVDFLISSIHPSKRDPDDREEFSGWAHRAHWRGFQVLNVEQGAKDDNLGFVEFIATYCEGTTFYEHHERSEFHKVDGKWFFFDGVIVKKPQYVRETPKIGRNDPCPCGSGKKYKKCCGK